MTIRLRQIDDLNRKDHSYLDAKDECYFLHEYTKGLSYKESEVSNLIYNLKRKPSYKSRPGVWKYKLRTIGDVGKDLAANLNPKWLKTATLIPIPPSKTNQHPDYDDRMSQVLQAVQKYSGISCDIRELIVQTTDKESTHTKDEKRDIDEIKADYELNDSLTDPAPKAVGIFDDMLTTGAHFCACRDLLAERFPGVSIVGIFVTRRMIPERDLEGFFDISDFSAD